MHNICQRMQQYLLLQPVPILSFSITRFNLKSWAPHIFQKPLPHQVYLHLKKISGPSLLKLLGSPLLKGGHKMQSQGQNMGGGLPISQKQLFFQNLAQSGFLKYIDKPLGKYNINIDKSYEVFLIYCQHKTDRYTDRQTSRKKDRHTGRLKSLIAQNFNLVGLIRIALIKNDKDY